MLNQLHIENIAVMDNVSIEFEDGLNILTGETGAGKSILIDSVNLLTGDRSSKDLVRTGCEKARVEGIIYSENEKVFEILDQAGIPYDKSDPIILTRDISKDGKNVVRINGRITTTLILKSVCANLINIHGQHDNQSILNASYHRELLDSFSGICDELSDYKQTFDYVKKLENELNELSESEKLKDSKTEILNFQLKEIKDADLSVGEEEELKQKRAVFLNSEAVVSSANACYSYLYGDEDKEGAVNLLQNALSALQTLSKFDLNAKDSYNKLSDIIYNIEDASNYVRDLLDSSDFEEIDINYIESRLDLISRLKRKYGNSVEEILETCDKIQQELYSIENSEYSTDQLKKSLAKAKKELEKKAEVITTKRKENAEKLETAVMGELADLEMANTKFKVQITDSDFNPYGKEKIEFLISPNKGEDLKPLTKIASGGELSRIILALKVVLSELDTVETLIFDEVDSGVSGKAAQKIGIKLKKISKSGQVLVITHLAQVAAFADSHFKIEKTVKNDKTYSNVEKLDLEGRIRELSRIMSGSDVSDAVLKAAAELLQASEKEDA